MSTCSGVRSGGNPCSERYRCRKWASGGCLAWERPPLKLQRGGSDRRGSDIGDGGGCDGGDNRNDGCGPSGRKFLFGRRASEAQMQPDKAARNLTEIAEAVVSCNE